MLTFSFLMTMALIMETVVGDNVIGDKKKKKGNTMGHRYMSGSKQKMN